MCSMLKKRVTVVLTFLLLSLLPVSWYYGPRTAAATTAQATIEVSIDAGRKGDTFRVNGRKTSLKRLGGVIESATIADQTKTIVDIICDDEASMSSVLAVQRLLIDQNLLKVRFAGPTGKPVPHMLPSRAMSDRLKEIDPRNLAKLEIDEHGSVNVDEETVGVSEIAVIIGKKADANPLLIVSVHASPNAHYGHFLKVLAELRKTKVNRVMIHNPTAR